MQELGTVLKDTLKQTGIDREIQQKKTLFLWEEIVGKTIAKNCKAYKIQKKKLIIKASTPVWRNEITLKKEELVEKTNQFFGENIIKDIKVI